MPATPSSPSPSCLLWPDCHKRRNRCCRKSPSHSATPADCADPACRNRISSLLRGTECGQTAPGSTFLPLANSLKMVPSVCSINGKHVVLSGKTHLHIHLIEFTRRPVGAGILIAKTRRNLKIFVKTRHHQQLLKLLRCLRQGIKLTRIKPRRHQKVARPFRRRSGQNRRLIFGKTLLAHQLAGTFNHRRTQQNVFVNALLAQIEETVFQTISSGASSSIATWNGALRPRNKPSARRL